MGYSPAVWAGLKGGGEAGGEQAYMQAGSFGHQKIERTIPCREEKRRLRSHLGTKPRLGFLLSPPKEKSHGKGEVEHVLCCI